jgi:hypothetical protein
MGGAMLALLFSLISSSYASNGSQSDLPKRIGKTLTISCRGEASDRYIAMRLALDQCRSLATEFLKTSFTVRSLTVQTNHDSSFHSEISSSNNLTGLECKIIKKEEAEKDGVATVALDCEYDTSKLTITSIAQRPVSDVNSSVVRSIVLSSIPICSDIVLTGLRARTIKCSVNPLRLTLYPEDKEVIIRADGYKPIHLERLEQVMEVRFEK